LELASRRLRPLVGEVVSEGPLSGATVVGVEARGKHLLVHADDGRSLHAIWACTAAFAWRPPGRGRHVLRTSRLCRSSEALVRSPPPGCGSRWGRFASDFDLAPSPARMVDRPVGEVLLTSEFAGPATSSRAALWECRIDPFAPLRRSTTAASDWPAWPPACCQGSRPAAACRPRPMSPGPCPARAIRSVPRVKAAAHDLVVSRMLL
jgi:hypothetical protein